jgi:ADP-heptose:LPS heptosyltransferase
MTNEAVWWLDKNIGRPLCFFLTLLRRICCRKGSDADRYEKPSRILFIKLIEQGSTVLAYPALKRAQELAGRDNIYFLVFRENRPILDIIDAVPASNIIELNSESVMRFLASVFKALATIRREKIDAVIDMEFFARASAILSFLSGARTRVGLHMFTCEGPYRGDLFTHKLMYNPYLHTMVLFAGLVEAAYCRPPAQNAPLTFRAPRLTNELPRFTATETERNEVINRIAEIKESPVRKPIVILNPNVSDRLPIRKWPEENFVRLGTMLAGEFPEVTVVLTGTAQEKQRIDAIAHKIPGAVSLAGHTNLKELLTLYCISDILITNDSGPALFSALTPVQAVILFGPETPILYGYADERRITITADLICSPCVNVYNMRKSPCKTGTCLQSIKVEDVYRKVKGLLR